MGRFPFAPVGPHKVEGQSIVWSKNYIYERESPITRAAQKTCLAGEMYSVDIIHDDDDELA
jgi:hypothetical protein